MAAFARLCRHRRYSFHQQLILGGRHPQLRAPRTIEALAALAKAGFIDPDDAKALTAHYGDLRKYEHGAQMREDAQTHLAPEEDAAREQLARLSGFKNLKAFDAAFVAVLTDVHKRYLALFPEFESLGLEEGTLSFTGVEPHPATLDTLARLGFEAGETVWRDMAKWLGGRISATRTERARELLTRLAPRLIKICAQTQTADMAFRAFGSFFERVNGGVSLLAMFLQEPDKLARIIDLMLISPRLSDTLAGRPAILDAMIAPDFLDIEIDALGDEYSKLADETLQVMLPVAARETQRRAGDIKGHFFMSLIWRCVQAVVLGPSRSVLTHLSAIMLRVRGHGNLWRSPAHASWPVARPSLRRG